MKKMMLVIIICGILVGGIITTYAYLHYTDCSTYQNGIFVNRDVDETHETADSLYKSL